MKFCLHYNVNEAYLKQADEIMLPYKEVDRLKELVFKYKDKDFIIDCINADIDWDKVRRYSEMSNHRVVLKVKSIMEMNFSTINDIRYIYGFPIQTFYELQTIKNTKTEAVYIGSELFFRFPEVKKFNIKIRHIPNKAYDDALPHNDGVCGTWIRPEDLESLYGEYIDTIEFDLIREPSQEETLFKIYAKDKTWSSRLGLIIENLDFGAYNPGIKSEDTKFRIDCEHECQRDFSYGKCKICYNIMKLSDPKLYEEVLEEIERRKAEGTYEDEDEDELIDENKSE